MATFGSETVTVAPFQGQHAAPAVEVVDGESTTTLAPGAIAAIGESEVSVGSDGGIVCGTGSEETTLALLTQQGRPASSVVAAIGSESATVALASGSSSGVAVAYHRTTTTMAQGSVATIDGTQVSLASDGNLVYGTGSERSTLTMRKQSASGSESDAQATTIDGSTNGAAATSSVAEQTGNGADRLSVSCWTSTMLLALMALYV